MRPFFTIPLACAGILHSAPLGSTPGQPQPGSGCQPGSYQVAPVDMPQTGDILRSTMARWQSPAAEQYRVLAVTNVGERQLDLTIELTRLVPDRQNAFTGSTEQCAYRPDGTVGECRSMPPGELITPDRTVHSGIRVVSFVEGNVQSGKDRDTGQSRIMVTLFDANNSVDPNTLPLGEISHRAQIAINGFDEAARPRVEVRAPRVSSRMVGTETVGTGRNGSTVHGWDREWTPGNPCAADDGSRWW